MPRLFIPVFSFVAAVSAGAAEHAASKSSDDTGVVFRPPFTLRIRVDREHYYEEKKGKVPYVYRGDVYLFIGDRFGLKIDVADGAVRPSAMNETSARLMSRSNLQKLIPSMASTPRC